MTKREPYLPWLKWPIFQVGASVLLLVLTECLHTGQGRDLVTVVEDIDEKGAVIGGETLSSREAQDLNRGRLFTRNLVEEGGCLLADSLQSALTSSIHVSRC